MSRGDFAWLEPWSRCLRGKTALRHLTVQVWRHLPGDRPFYVTGTVVHLSAFTAWEMARLTDAKAAQALAARLWPNGAPPTPLNRRGGMSWFRAVAWAEVWVLWGWRRMSLEAVLHRRRLLDQVDARANWFQAIWEKERRHT